MNRGKWCVQQSGAAWKPPSYCHARSFGCTLFNESTSYRDRRRDPSLTLSSRWYWTLLRSVERLIRRAATRQPDRRAFSVSLNEKFYGNWDSERVTTSLDKITLNVYDKYDLLMVQTSISHDAVFSNQNWSNYCSRIFLVEQRAVHGK